MLRTWFPSGIALFRKNKIQEDRYSVEEATAKVVNFVMEARRHNAMPMSETLRKESIVLLKNASGEARVLGRGGFVTVYLGTYLKNGKKESVAAKISDFVKLDYLMDPRYPAYWVAVSMIFRLKKDNEYCMGEKMALVGIGAPLMAFATSKKPIGSIEFLGLLEEASRAVRYLHDYGMVHSDVKAENFLIKKKLSHSVKECAYHVRISDFGLTTPNVKYSTKRSVGGTPGYMGKKDKELASYMRDMYAFGKMIRDLLRHGNLYLSDELFERLQALADSLVVEDRDMRPDAGKLVKLVKAIAAEERKMEEDRPSQFWVSFEADSPPSSAHTRPVPLPPVHCHTRPSSLAVVEKPVVADYIAALPYCRAAMILRQNACMSDSSEQAKGDLTIHVGADPTNEKASHPAVQGMGAEAEPLALGIQQLHNTPAPLHACQDKATASRVPVASAMKAARSACKAMRKGAAHFVRALLPTRAK
eukprot:gene29126-32344_t